MRAIVTGKRVPADERPQEKKKRMGGGLRFQRHREGGQERSAGAIYANGGDLVRS